MSQREPKKPIGKRGRPSSTLTISKEMKGNLTNPDIDRSGAKKIWEDAIPNLVEKNVELQKRSLKVIEEHIDECKPSDAARIYAILHDRCVLMVGPTVTKSDTTFNMFIEDGSGVDADSIIESVYNRMKQGETIDAEVTEIGK